MASKKSAFGGNRPMSGLGDNHGMSMPTTKPRQNITGKPQTEAKKPDKQDGSSSRQRATADNGKKERKKTATPAKPRRNQKDDEGFVQLRSRMRRIDTEDFEKFSVLVSKAVGYEVKPASLIRIAINMMTDMINEDLSGVQFKQMSRAPTGNYEQLMANEEHIKEVLIKLIKSK